MKKKFFSILAVMLMTLTANAEKTITWDYNTFKSITFDAQSYYPNYSGEYPLISKDGITMYVPVDYWGRFYFINCNMGSNSSHYDYESIYFYSTVGRITSINIKCNDGSQTRIEDADFYQWTINQTSVSWTGSIPRCEVSMPLRAKSVIQGIQQISFTIDEENIYNILNPKDGDVLNGTTISIDYDIAPPYTYDDFNPTYEAKEGTTIIYKPINEKQTNRGWIWTNDPWTDDPGIYTVRMVYNSANVNVYSAPIFLIITRSDGSFPKEKYATKQMSSLQLPSHIHAIADQAFVATATEQIIIPSGCSTIGVEAFANSPNLKEIRIPASVTQIDKTALDGCGPVFILTDSAQVLEQASKNDFWIPVV